MRIKIKVKINVFIVVLILSLPSLCFAGKMGQLPDFSKEDRVLVLAPHPDDEAIGTGGIIQNARRKGADIKIVYFTNGDHNEVSFIVYEKRFTFRKVEFVHMGLVRRDEAIAGVESLGIDEKNMMFLGYPDFGTLAIFTKYWGRSKPFKDFITRINAVPYKVCLSPNAPYLGESILKDLEKIIFEYKPTKIFVSHPVDANRDHRALYLFLKVVLWNLEGRIKNPEIFPYLIHVADWPKPRGYHPGLVISPPEKLKNSAIDWKQYELSVPEIKAKHNAISFYKSQIEYNPHYLFTFARKNELFGDYPVIKIKERKGEEIEWHDLDGSSKDVEVTDLMYAKKNKNLLIKISLRRKIDKYFGINAYIFGYSKKVDFSKMPKINIGLGIRGTRVKEKRKLIALKDLDVKYGAKSVTIEIPLSDLGNPDYILASVRATVRNTMTLDDTAWRILDVTE